MQELITAIVIVIAVSAICSGIEAAFLSVSLLKVKEKAQAHKGAAVILLKIRENIGRPLTTIVILNNIANIGGSMLVGEIAISYFGSAWIGSFSALLTFLIIIFGEIIPKTIGENYSMSISLFLAKPIYFLTKILTPIVWIIEKITYNFISKKAEYTINESEIKAMAKIGHQEGAIEKNEAEMIHRIFNLNDVTADKIMTPRVAITCVKFDSPLKDIKDFIINSQHSRIIAIGKDKDDIKGVLFKNELLAGIVSGDENKPASDFLHEAYFVTGKTKVDQLLKHFRKTRRHIAVVADEYGGISGIVSLEDVLEEITGEIIDETDEVIDMQKFAKSRNNISC